MTTPFLPSGSDAAEPYLTPRIAIISKVASSDLMFSRLCDALGMAHEFGNVRGDRLGRVAELLALWYDAHGKQATLQLFVDSLKTSFLGLIEKLDLAHLSRGARAEVDAFVEKIKNVAPTASANNPHDLRVLAGGANANDDDDDAARAQVLEPRKVTISGKEFFIVEGDLLLDAGEYDAYKTRIDLIKAAAKTLPGVESTAAGSALLGMVNALGQPIKWGAAVAHNLTYRINVASFATYHDLPVTHVANLMRLACGNWEQACGVKFVEITDPATPVLFEVVYNSDVSDLRLMAYAFFPDEPASERRVNICPGFARNGFNPIGVLTHELGHVLGFRHEHIRVGLGAPEPLAGTTPLTAYDSQSVMHYYFAGRGGSTNMQITAADRLGAQRLYGLPLFEVVEFST